jgi:hypothetical protein
LKTLKPQKGVACLLEQFCGFRFIFEAKLKEEKSFSYEKKTQLYKVILLLIGAECILILKYFGSIQLLGTSHSSHNQSKILQKSSFSCHSTGKFLTPPTYWLPLTLNYHF